MMEVSGRRRGPDLDKGSADATVYCQPCGEGGKRAVALGFCQTCEEYMCGPCIEAHKRFKLSRNHKMLSKDKMPSFYPSTKQSDMGVTEYCRTHPNEMIKFYCPTHSDLGCGDCVVIAHRTCKVDYIADVSKGFVNENEFKRLESSIKRAEDILYRNIRNAEKLLFEVVNQSKYEIDRLREFREEINTYLDRRENELLDNLKEVKTKDENDLTALKTDCKSVMTALEAMRNEMSSIDVSVNQRYLAARRAQNELRGLHVEMGKMAGRMKAQKYRFVKDADTERLLETKKGFGTLDVAGEFRRESTIPVPDHSTVTWKKEVDIPVREAQDKDTCWITGSVLLSSGHLLLADCKNNSAKLVDVTNRLVTSRLQLPSGPWDVCTLPNDQAAITLPNTSMIQLLSTMGGQLSCEKEYKVSSGCRGIASYNNRLYVSYVTNPRIEVMTFDGHSISTFKTDDGKQLAIFPDCVSFNLPFFLTASASTPPTLYVSDHTEHTVLQLSLDGKVQQKYRDELKYPKSMVEVGPGQLLVCGQVSGNVMLLTERDDKMTENLGQKDGLTHPYSIAFCPYTCSIFIGMLKNDSLKVFNAN